MKTKLKRFGAWLMAMALAFAGAGAVQAGTVASLYQGSALVAQYETIAAAVTAWNEAGTGDYTIAIEDGDYAVSDLVVCQTSGKSLVFKAKNDPVNGVCKVNFTRNVDSLTKQFILFGSSSDYAGSGITIKGIKFDLSTGGDGNALYLGSGGNNNVDSVFKPLVDAGLVSETYAKVTRYCHLITVDSCVMVGAGAASVTKGISGGAGASGITVKNCRAEGLNYLCEGHFVNNVGFALTVTGCIVTGCKVMINDQNGAQYGGPVILVEDCDVDFYHDYGIRVVGGDVTIRNCNFNGTYSGDEAGGAIVGKAPSGDAAPRSIVVDECSFTKGEGAPNQYPFYSIGAGWTYNGEVTTAKTGYDFPSRPTVKVDTQDVEVKDASGKVITDEKATEAVQAIVTEMKELDVANTQTGLDEAVQKESEDSVNYLSVSLKGIQVAKDTGLSTVTYEVKPMVKTTVVTDEGKKTTTEKIANEKIEKPVSFVLPVASFQGTVALVSHFGDDGALVEGYVTEVKGSGDSKFVELASQQFSTFVVADAIKIGEGFYRNPAETEFYIMDQTGLEAFRDSVNDGNNYVGKIVKLMNDIAFSGDAWTCGIGLYKGNNSNGFIGTFDGNGCTISGLKIVAAETTGVGFFSNIDSQDENHHGYVKNLTLSGAEIEGKKYVGGIAGFARWCDIENCSVVGCTVAAAEQAGGIVGYFQSADIIGCVVEGGSVSASEKVAAGIVGKTQYSGEIVGCTVKGVSVSVANVSANCGAAGIVCQIVQDAGDGASTLAVTDNNIVNVTTKNGDAVVFAPIGEFRNDTFKADSIGGFTFLRNHWEPKQDDADQCELTYDAAGNKIVIANFNPVAQIVGKGLAARYETIPAAIDAAVEGDMVQLLCDVELNNVDFEPFKRVTLDFNGKSLKVRTNAGICFGSAPVVFKNGTLDLSGATGSEHTGDFTQGWNKTIIWLMSSAQVTFEDINLVGQNVTAGYIMQLSNSGGNAPSSLALVHSTVAIDGCTTFAELGKLCSVNISEGSALSFKKLGSNCYVFGDTTQFKDASVSLTDSTLEIVNDSVVSHRGFGFLGAVALDNSTVTVKNLGQVAFRSCNVELTNDSRILVDNNTDKPINECKLIVDEGCTVDVENCPKNGMILVDGSIFKADSTVVVSNCCTTAGGSGAIDVKGSLTVEKGANVYCYGNLVDNSGTATIAIADGRYDELVQNKATTKFDVTGGIYKESPNPAFVSKKAVVVDNADPETMAAYPYRVERLPDVAQVGEETFVSIEDAYAAVPANGTIKLLADAVWTGTIRNIYQGLLGRNFTVDLNGKTLTMNGALYTNYNVTFRDGDVFVSDPTGAVMGEHAWNKLIYVEWNKNVGDVQLLFDNVKFSCEKANIPTLIQTSTKQVTVKFNNSELYLSNCEKPVYMSALATASFAATKIVANGVRNCLIPCEDGREVITLTGCNLEMIDCDGFACNCNNVTIDGSDVSATGLVGRFLNGCAMTLKNGAKVVLGDSPNLPEYKGAIEPMRSAGVVVEDGCELTISGMPDAAVLSFNKVSSVAAGAEVSIDSPITASAGLSIAAGAYKSVTASGAVDLTGGIYTVRPLDSYVVNPAYAVFDNDDEATKATHPYWVAAKPEIVEMYNGDGTPFGKTYSLELGFKNVPAGGKILLVGACDESFTTDRTDGFTFQIKEGVIYDVSKITLPNGYALKDNGNGSYSYYKMPIATITHDGVTTKYDSLGAASTAAVSGDTIVLSPMIIDISTDVWAIRDLTGKTVTIKGAGQDKTTLLMGPGLQKGTADGNSYLSGAYITFEDMSMDYNHNGYTGMPHHEHALLHPALQTYRNVRILGAIETMDAALFENCTFAGPVHADTDASASKYMLWVYHNKATVKDCTFEENGQAYVKLYNGNNDHVCAVEISGTTFKGACGSKNCVVLSSNSKNEIYDVLFDESNVYPDDIPVAVGTDKGSITVVNGAKDEDGKYTGGALIADGLTAEKVAAFESSRVASDFTVFTYTGEKTKVCDFAWYVGPKQVEPKTDDVEVKDEEGNPLPQDQETATAVSEIQGKVTDTLKGDDIAKFTETGLDDAVVTPNGTMTEKVAEAVKGAAATQKGGELTPEEKAAIDALTNEKNRIEIELKAMGMKVETVEESKKVSLSIVKYDVTPKVKVTTVIGGAETIVETVIPNEALVGKPLTFRLAVNDNFGEFARVDHTDAVGNPVEDSYLTKVFAGTEGKYVELKSEKFSFFTVYADITEQPVCKVGDVYYTSIADALEHAADDAVIVLVKDHSEQNLKLKETQRIDTDGHTFTGTVESVPTGFDPLLVTDSHGQVFVAPLAYAAVTEPGATNLAVRVKPDYIAGKTAEEVTAWLQETDGNRPRWQNYAMGVSGTATLTPTAKPAAAGSSVMTITVPEGTTFAPTYKTGVKVSYSLLQYTSPGGAPFKYATRDTPVFEVDVKNIPTKTEWKIQTTFIQEY